eukprot:1901108-Amphidinium_carterae.3
MQVQSKFDHTVSSQHRDFKTAAIPSRSGKLHDSQYNNKSEQQPAHRSPSLSIVLTNRCEAGVYKLTMVCTTCTILVVLLTLVSSKQPADQKGLSPPFLSCPVRVRSAHGASDMSHMRGQILVVVWAVCVSRHQWWTPSV